MNNGALVRRYKAGTKELVGYKMVRSDSAGNPPRLHFGLAKVEKVDIDVVYPSTKETVS